MTKHKCGIANYYFGSFISEKEFPVPINVAGFIALDLQIRAFFDQCRQSGESTAKGAVAGDCPNECKYKHSYIAVMLDQFACNAEDKFVGKNKIQVWRVKVIVNWIAHVVCDGHGPDTGPDTTVSYNQLLEWMPEDKRIQAIADQKHLYNNQQ
jgi:hypothetical protein